MAVGGERDAEVMTGPSPPSDDIETSRNRSSELFLLELAASRPSFELAEPPKAALSHLWKWDDYYPRLVRAAAQVDVDVAFRRKLGLYREHGRSTDGGIIAIEE